MDDKFKGYINTVRDYLKRKPDKGLPFIKINQGNNKIQHENPMLNEYINFLRECNGAAFGTGQYYYFLGMSFPRRRGVFGGSSRIGIFGG